MNSKALENAHLIDVGSAPEFFANGLARVDVMGAVVRLVFYVERSIVGENGLEVLEECPVTVIIPNDAGQAIQRFLM